MKAAHRIPSSLRGLCAAGQQPIASSSRLLVSATPSPRFAIAAPSGPLAVLRTQQPCRRSLHSTPALDPKDSAAEDFAGSIEAEDAAAAAAAAAQSAFTSQMLAGGAASEGDALVYVPMSYLHPSTRQGDDTSTADATVDSSSSSLATRVPKQAVPLSRHVFGQEPRTDIMHSAVVYYLDGLRAGTASTKTRSEVNYSGRKIRPQKGSGQARLGSRGNPLLKGGGVIFGPKPRDFATELPRRVRELALRSALSARWREGRLHVVPSLYWDPPPRVTGPLARLLSVKGWKNVLFLSAPRGAEPAEKLGLRQRGGRPSAMDPVYPDEAVRDAHDEHLQNLAIALGNIQGTELIRLDTLTEEKHQEARKPEDKKKPGELHAYEVLERERVVLDVGAVEWLEEKLGGSFAHDMADIVGEQELQSEAELDLAAAEARLAEAQTGDAASSSAPTPAASAV